MATLLAPHLTEVGMMRCDAFAFAYSNCIRLSVELDPASGSLFLHFPTHFPNPQPIFLSLVLLPASPARQHVSLEGN